MHTPITLANFSFVNLVFIFRCSSSTTNPVYERRVNLLVLVCSLCSLSSHRHSCIGFICISRLSIHIKQQINNRKHKTLTGSRENSHPASGPMVWVVQPPDPSCGPHGIGASKTPSVNRTVPNRDRTYVYGRHMSWSTVTDASSPPKSIRPALDWIKMSAPEEQGGQDYNDILGFAGPGRVQGQG
jgi:hypothetical protein